MTIENARAILGKRFELLDDEAILKIIKLFEAISLVAIEKGLITKQD